MNVNFLHNLSQRIYTTCSWYIQVKIRSSHTLQSKNLLSSAVNLMTRWWWLGCISDTPWLWRFASWSACSLLVLAHSPTSYCTVGDNLSLYLRENCRKFVDRILNLALNYRIHHKIELDIELQMSGRRKYHLCITTHAKKTSGSV